MADGLRSPHSSAETAKEMAKKLPFKIGQVVEAKSFSQGYRGAWFECKIVEIDKGGRNQLRYKFKYVHFPEEPLHWSQAFQQRHRGQVESTELMLRPLPPPILQEKDARYATYDGIVVVPYAWEIGDLVNWWCDDVWWEATVTEIKPNGKVKINLFKPPFGEGGVHVTEALELRPALLWSSKDQWTLPISKKKANGKPAARIVELSSKRWTKLSGQVKQLALATPPLFVDVELDQTGDLDVSKGPAREVDSLLRSPNGETLSLRTSPSKVVFIIQHLPGHVCINGDGTHTRTVPCLEVLRRAAEPFANNTHGNDMDGNLCDLSAEERNRQDKCTSSGTVDDDSEDISNALMLKRQQFWRHNRKFMMYRKHINRAVDSDRRRRFKRHIFADCKTIDSSDESDGI